MGRATMSKNRHDQYVFEPFRIDLAERMLTRAEVAIPLPPKGFDLLALLVQNAGNLLEKERIIQALWPGTFVEEANVSNLIGLLRKTLGDSVKRPEYIQTVPKRGYRFVAATVPLEPKPQESRARTEEILRRCSSQQRITALILSGCFWSGGRIRTLMQM